MQFEWDSVKAATNLKKHGVDFFEAISIFGDPFEITISDPDHSEDESRFLSLGMSRANRLILVAYTEREGRIRVIHAREAAREEWETYASIKPKDR